MPLKIQYASDLHLEFPSNLNYMNMNPLQPEGDILVLGGDIVPFAIMDRFQDFFSLLSDQFEAVYWIPGNHEYYHFDIAKHRGILNEEIRSNVFLVNNVSVVHRDVKLIFSSLWSKISPQNQWQIERGLNDFHQIKNNGFRLTAADYNELHDESLTFIKNELDELKEDKLAVFTHHCPTFLNYPEQYKGDTLNEAFAVELYDFIESSGITYWVYGHHHTNTPEFNIGNTKLITNQLGYVQQKENSLFQTNKYFALL
ncbi:MAG: metallophosphoesterase [Bacteroidia bacterium]